MGRVTSVIAAALLSGLLTVSTASGCAGQKTSTVRTETVEEPAPPAGTVDAGQPQATRKTETTTTTENDNRSPGIIGSAFRLVWAVISFPFRVIGDLF